MSACESFMNNRHSILKEYQTKLCLTNDIKVEPSINGKRHELIALDLKFSFPSIAYPLPLPQVSNEWGVAQLILRLKLPSVMDVLMSLLLERSVLIIGERSEEVSACTFALAELLKPYKWSSIFLPILSDDMIDFISSPVPFIAGMVSRDRASVKRIEDDERVKHERKDGLTVINTTDWEVLWTEEDGLKNKLFPVFHSIM